jgi:outer membrane receptor protein involved in Fe transport
MLGNRDRLSFYLIALILAVIVSAPGRAQTVTGTISGTVVDASGGALAGVAVSIIDERAKSTRSVTTNGSGDFVFTAVQPGNYTIKIEQRGFSIFQRQGNVLTANEHLSVGELALKVGELSETVTTMAEGTPVQTESTEHSALISSKQLEQISIRGRDVTSLLRILPGVSFQGQSESAGGGFGSGVPNIQGGRNTWNTVNVDGVRGNDLGSPNIFSSTVNFDAISEVKVLLNSYQAEYGGNSSANISIITKSGSREFHGSGYYYKRHEQFNANDFFNNSNIVLSPLTGEAGPVAKPRYRFNTLGFTLGGPVWIPKVADKLKEKLFFFYSFEDSQTLNPQDLRRVTVPTERERNGDFSQSPVLIRDPRQTAPCTTTNRAGCFSGNVIPQELIDKNGQALLNVFPLPNALDRTITEGNYNYLFQESIKAPKRQHLVRADYRPSEKDSFYVRGSTWYADNQGIAVPAGTANWGLAGLHYTFTDNGITGNWTHVFSPQLVNEASIGVRHSVEKGPPLNDAELAKIQKSTYGITLGQFNPELNPLGIIPRVVTFSGIQNPAQITYDGRTPLRGADTFISFTDTVSFIRGSHTLKAGVYAERVRNYEGATATFAGELNFSTDANNPIDTGYTYANALLGNFLSYTESTARPSGEGRQSLVEWFIQDSWKASRRFSLEFGVRFSWYNQWYQSTVKSAAFSLERYDPSKAPLFYQPVCAVALPSSGLCPSASRRAHDPRVPISKETMLPAVLIGAFVPGTGDPYNGMVLGTDESYPRGFKDQQPVLLQPRFGFAWDIRGDGKMALRGSFGVFNQTRVSANAIWTDVSRNPPISDNPRIFYGNLDSLLSTTGVLFPSSVTGFDPDAPTPVTYNYTLGIQRDVGFGTVIDVAYVGSVSRHLQQNRNINAIPYGARFQTQNIMNGILLTDDFLRPYRGFGNITYYENAGLSNYNALQVAGNRRFTRGLQFGVAYTWSKTMNYADGDRDGVASIRPHRIWNYGKAIGFDQTHVMVINYTWDLPKPSQLWNNRIIRHVFDNWQVSGITSFASGTPRGIGFSNVPSADITGGGDGARVVLSGNPILPRGERSIDRWFDTSVIARPARGDFGNAPKDVIRLPGTNNWDVSLFKNIPLKREGTSLQFRWELYNVFNHTHFSNVDTDAQFNASGVQIDTRFGKVFEARDPRYMQLSLRLVF